MNPQVDIMMPVYNGMPHIKESIRTVLNQTYPNWHCIICDDGSTDDTFSYLKTLESDSRFTILRNDKNKGRGISRQRILDACTAPYVCMLDAGDLMHPDRIALQVECLERHPEVGLVSSGMLSFGRTTDIIRVRSFDNTEIKVYSNHRSIFFAPSMFRTSVAKSNNVTFGAMPQCEDPFFFSKYFRFCPYYSMLAKPLYYYNEFDSFSKIGTLCSYLYLVYIYFKAHNLKIVILNLAKFFVSLFILPFISLKKRAIRRGRPATTQEAEEFYKVSGLYRTA